MPIAGVVGRVIVWGSRKLLSGVLRGIVGRRIAATRIGQWLIKHPFATVAGGLAAAEVGKALLDRPESAHYVDAPIPASPAQPVIDVREAEAELFPELDELAAEGRAEALETYDVYPEEDALMLLEEFERERRARAPLIKVTQVCNPHCKEQQ
jgi:hypothetical protein